MSGIVGKNLGRGSGVVTATPVGADVVSGANLADDACNSEHYTDGSVDLIHMSSESVDEDNLHISNSGSNGEFLSKQSGDTGGLTWAAPAGGVDGITTSANATAISITADEEVTMPKQPGFVAHQTASFTDTTGDGTAYNMVEAYTEITDQNADFTAGTFTAPVTGTYIFVSNIAMGVMSTQTILYGHIVTSNRTLRLMYEGFNTESEVTAQSRQLVCITDMDAADTAHVRITVSGGPKQIDIHGDGGTGNQSQFSGWLLG